MKRPAFEVLVRIYTQLYLAYKELHKNGIPIQEIDEELRVCADCIIKALREQRSITFDNKGDYSSR